jgi:hypothetical protein
MPEATQSCVFLKRKNRKSTPQSLFSPLFSTAVRSFEPQEFGLFFSSFFASIENNLFELKIPPF